MGRGRRGRVFAVALLAVVASLLGACTTTGAKSAVQLRLERDGAGDLSKPGAVPIGLSQWLEPKPLEYVAAIRDLCNEEAKGRGADWSVSLEGQICAVAIGKASLMEQAVESERRLQERRKGK